MAIQPPYRGQPLRASWATEVTDVVNALSPMAAPGLLSHHGPGFSGYTPVPSNKRQLVVSPPCPFYVRYVEESEDDESIPYDGWEIYLPSGCVTVGSSCLPINPAAYRMVSENGGVPEKKNLTDWYRLPVPPDNPSDGDQWVVQIHAKCCAGRTGIDTFQEWPKRLLWAEAHKPDMTQEEREEFVADVGDTLSSFVGSIKFEEDEDGNLQKSYVHSVKTPIMTLETASSEPMALFFAFTVDDDALSLTFDKLFVKNQSFSAAGSTYISSSMKEIEKDDEEIYLKIVTTTTPYTAEIRNFQTLTISEESITVPQQIEEEREPGEIWIMLYSLKNGHITSNNLKAISNIQIYQ